MAIQDDAIYLKQSIVGRGTGHFRQIQRRLLGFLYKFADITTSRYTYLKAALHIFLGIMIVLLTFLLYRSIIQPIRFNREKDMRVNAAISKLVDIRKAQNAYRDIHGRYTESFDSLIRFIQTDSFEIQRKTGTYNPDEMNENEAIQAGLVHISSIRVSVLDSLFSGGTDIESIRYVPYADHTEFVMDAGQVITVSRVAVKVFEVYVMYETLLHDLNQQLVTNYIAERERIAGFPGLKIGSMIEATNNTGNWE